jgi:threonine dehydratase
MTSEGNEQKYCITMKDVEEARERIKDHAIYTSVMGSDNISDICGCKLYFKLETMQRCKAFKFRGALNKLRTIKPGSTVVAVSAGNHSQGVALASQLCDCKAIIYMPEIAPAAKVQATQHYGGEVIQKGNQFDDAKAEMLQALEENPEWIFVPPYNDKYIIAGTATIGMEICEQVPDVDTVVIPIGGGGLISGVAFAVKNINPKIRVVGVQMASCPNAFIKFNEKKNRDISGLTHEALTPLADGIAVKSPGDLNLQIIYDMVDEVVVVTEDEVASSVALMAERAKIISEGAGATPLAAILNKKFSFKPNEKIVCVVSGGNIPLRMLSRCIDRALFLRKQRISVSVVVPYGIKNLASLISIIAKNHAEVVSCNSAPHTETFANKEQYIIIIDVDGPDMVNRIKNEVIENGWTFDVQDTMSIE